MILEPFYDGITERDPELVEMYAQELERLRCHGVARKVRTEECTNARTYAAIMLARRLTAVSPMID